MEQRSLQAWGTSVTVANVQALATSMTKDDDHSNCVPQRYIRQEDMAEPIAEEDEEGELPVIDFGRLLDPHFSQVEAAKLHRACAEWGFFQLINHGIPDKVIEKVKTDIVEFFKLPLAEKNACRQIPGSIEGYGQAFVVSDEQKLDWEDMLYIITRPIQKRSMRFWPTQPATFSSETLSSYSLDLKRVASALMELMAKNLGVEAEEFCSIFHGQPQGIRINYYPPCPKAEEVMGISPHTDGSGLTLLLQISDVQGLQIKRKGMWIPVMPLPGALIANVGDIIEMVSNGEYKSIEHRATINPETERLSVAAFHGPREDALVGPLPGLVKEGRRYKTVEYRDYVKALFSARLDGRKLLDSFKFAA